MDSASLTMLKKAGAQHAAVSKELEKPAAAENAAPGNDPLKDQPSEEGAGAEIKAAGGLKLGVPEGASIEAAEAVAKAQTDADAAAVKQTKPSNKKGKAVAVAGKEGEVIPPDVIADIVHEIENLKEPQAHAKLAEELEIGPMSDFKIGGLLSLINANKWYQPYDKFDQFVAAKVEPMTGIGYRKAMYLIEIYNAIVESGVAWSKIAGIGWTKLQIIACMLKKGNPDQWLQIAKEQNAVTLAGTVKEAKKSGDAAQLEDQSMKAVTTMSFKVHTDQKATIEAAIEKAKGVSQTDVSTVALEYICLDYMGGQTLAQRLQAVGPTQSGKAVKQAFKTEGELALLLHEIGFEEGLNAIAAAFPGINIDVSIPETETPADGASDQAA
jgi:hypothetical protein